MKKIVLLTMIIGLLFACELMAQAPGDTLWTTTYGGIDYDVSHSVQETTDGGYIIVGHTSSFGAGSNDVWLIKTNVQGDTLWTKTYGGTGNDVGRSVQETTDGGYIITGNTGSFGAGSSDVWLIKTNAQGDTLWTKTYGGTNYELSYSVQETTDGGYIIAGLTCSFGAGSSDVWLIKTNAQGDTLWTKTYGGTYDDWGRSVQETTDGGYIITGTTYSFGAGFSDVWIIKTNSLGDTLWTTTYGGTDYDEGRSVQETTDGGYIIAGTYSFSTGSGDVYLIRTDANGDTLWTRTYGGTYDDWGRSVQETTDGGYILIGYTGSFGAGSSDVWLIKTNAQGDTLWTKTFGGIGIDVGRSVQETTDGGYIIAGYTCSFGAGSGDVWLLKIYDITTSIEDDNPFLSETNSFFQNYPNPFNSTTTISFSVEDSDKNTTITIYNFKGQKIKTLIDKKLETDTHQIVWDGTDDSGNAVPSGIYFYKMECGDKYTGLKKMILMK